MPGPLEGIAPVAATASHPVWGEISAFFTPREFNYPYRMDVSFLRMLYRIRKAAGVPLRILSDHRPPARNADAGGAKGSAHLQSPCRTVDLHVKNNYERARILEAAVLEGIERIGVYPAKEDNSGSLHVDASSTHPSPRVWTRY
jgi:hypothetical protein